MMRAEHCKLCDRKGCPAPSRYWLGTGSGLSISEHSRVWNDCIAHAVDWRKRAITAEALVAAKEAAETAESLYRDARDMGQEGSELHMEWMTAEERVRLAIADYTRARKR